MQLYTSAYKRLRACLEANLFSDTLHPKLLTFSGDQGTHEKGEKSTGIRLDSRVVLSDRTIKIPESSPAQLHLSFLELGWWPLIVWRSCTNRCLAGSYTGRRVHSQTHLNPDASDTHLFATKALLAFSSLNKSENSTLRGAPPMQESNQK